MNDRFMTLYRSVHRTSICVEGETDGNNRKDIKPFKNVSKNYHNDYFKYMIVIEKDLNMSYNFFFMAQCIQTERLNMLNVDQHRNSSLFCVVFSITVGSKFRPTVHVVCRILIKSSLKFSVLPSPSVCELYIVLM